MSSVVNKYIFLTFFFKYVTSIELIDWQINVGVIFLGSLQPLPHAWQHSLAPLRPSAVQIVSRLFIPRRSPARINRLHEESTALAQGQKTARGYRADCFTLLSLLDRVGIHWTVASQCKKTFAIYTISV